MGREMISFYIFSRFMLEHFSDTQDYPWAKTAQMKGSSFTDAFYSDIMQMAEAYRSGWLKELSDNQRLYSNEDDVFDTINGFTPRKTSRLEKLFGKNLQGFPAIDTEVQNVSMKKIRGLDAYNFFITIHEEAIDHVIKNKFNI